MEQNQNFDFSIVKNLRMKRGMTAEALAGRAGITRATIAKLESGKGNPTIETLRALGKVFHLSACQLVEMAETGNIESARTAIYEKNGFRGFQIMLPGIEIFSLEASRGTRTISAPDLHDNTAEICMVISGRIKLTVLGESQTLEPGQAVRFKAIQDHELEALEDSNLILIHHLLI